jgi:hypothetical protein
MIKWSTEILQFIVSIFCREFEQTIPQVRMSTNLGNNSLIFKIIENSSFSIFAMKFNDLFYSQFSCSANHQAFGQATAPEYDLWVILWFLWLILSRIIYISHRETGQRCAGADRDGGWVHPREQVNQIDTFMGKTWGRGGGNAVY